MEGWIALAPALYQALLSTPALPFASRSLLSTPVCRHTTGLGGETSTNHSRSKRPAAAADGPDGLLQRRTAVSRRGLPGAAAVCQAPYGQSQGPTHLRPRPSPGRGSRLVTPAVAKRLLWSIVTLRPRTDRRLRARAASGQWTRQRSHRAHRAQCSSPACSPLAHALQSSVPVPVPGGRPARRCRPPTPTACRLRLRRPRDAHLRTTVTPKKQKRSVSEGLLQRMPAPLRHRCDALTPSFCTSCSPRSLSPTRTAAHRTYTRPRIPHSHSHSHTQPALWLSASHMRIHTFPFSRLATHPPPAALRGPVHHSSARTCICTRPRKSCT